MMRLALFEILKTPCSLDLDEVLHVLTAPQVFKLPLLRSCFAGGIIYKGKVVPLLAGEVLAEGGRALGLSPAYTLVCEAVYGPVAVPAEKIIRITKTGEICSGVIPGNEAQSNKCEIDGRDYHPLDLNRVLDDPDLTVCRLKD